jgi:UDP-2-acetamido-2,6-beta-L-arabino-hexul-4-ose reductase
MKKIGITGRTGFIGKHLYNTLGLFPNEFERIDFKKEFFDNPNDLDAFVSRCDVIVHLAAMNRYNSPEIIYQTNIGLVKVLIASLERTNSKAHVLFSSSSQEERDNLYGKSKKEGREMFSQWAQNSGGIFTGLIIPNVFGPFGEPYYNSVVATFCHQMSHGETPNIDVDGDVKLIYVGELIQVFFDEIRIGKMNPHYTVPHTSELKVSRILSLLNEYKEQYQDKGIIPKLDSTFEINLFNTYRCYMDIENHFPVKFIQHADTRGAFVEVIRLNVGGQVSFSTTLPGITRGNHFHTRKIERFAVIKGKALIQLRQIGTDKILNFEMDDKKPSYVDMPIWFTHNIQNTGEEELYTIFWINEFYNKEDPDTFFEKV